MGTSVTKKEVVRILEEIALLLELKGENPFKTRAYQNAARSIEQMNEELEDAVREGHLSDLKSVGNAISRKVTDLVLSGTLPYYETLKASVPPGHTEMLRIPGLGPKKIRVLYEKLGIETIGELEYACHENRLVELAGFGERTQGNILTGIDHLKRYKKRRLFAEVIDEAEKILHALQEREEVIIAGIAGSLRRSMEIVKDIDLLASSRNPEATADFFTSLPGVETVTAKGDTKVSVTLKSGIAADLRIVTEVEYPYALHHFTGSRQHNTAMRSRARRMGIKMNEYGLFGPAGNISCRSEKEIFSALQLHYIPPELRENTEEIEAAEAGMIPTLIETGDIRGVFHIHTRQSDGADSLDVIVREAKRRGLQYIGVTDHSQAAYYAGGLSREEIAKQHEAIDAINKKSAPFYVFKGIEADILPDGCLDYDEETLQRFDFVIAAVHSHFTMTEGEMTARIIRALDNPFTTILAHPTGRLLLAREPYAVDIKDIIYFAAERGKILELNANPHRLDLDWRQCITAKKKGVKIAINPDMHTLEGFGDMQFGVNAARKGWIESGDCINCLTLEEMKAFFAHRMNRGKRS